MLRTINFSSYMSLTSSNCYTYGSRQQNVQYYLEAFLCLGLRLQAAWSEQAPRTASWDYRSSVLQSQPQQFHPQNPGKKKTAQALTTQIRQDGRVITHCDWTSYCNGITGSFPLQPQKRICEYNRHMVGIKIQNRVIDSDKNQGPQCLISSTDAG
jgi:hypothetical protein